MTAADMAASMIREGVNFHAAVKRASLQLCEPYRAIAKELSRRSARNRKEAIEARERAAVKEMERQHEESAARFRREMHMDESEWTNATGG